MAEISVDDVETYTNGRLKKEATETARMLAAALAVARREAGWHVSPVRIADQIVVDGPDSRVLWLPTLKVVSIASVRENGILLDPNSYAPSAGNGPGLPRHVALRKTSRSYWTDAYGGVEVVMDHGFDEAEAQDWRMAVLSMVDQMSLVPVSAGTGASEFGLSGKRVDDVDYRYNAYAAMAEEVVFSISNVLDDYRLPDLEFL